MTAGDTLSAIALLGVVTIASLATALSYLVPHLTAWRALASAAYLVATVVGLVLLVGVLP